MILALLLITVLTGSALAQTNPTVTVQFTGSGSGTSSGAREYRSE
jgi:hypothetical protein